MALPAQFRLDEEEVVGEERSDSGQDRGPAAKGDRAGDDGQQVHHRDVADVGELANDRDDAGEDGHQRQRDKISGDWPCEEIADAHADQCITERRTVGEGSYAPNADELLWAGGAEHSCHQCNITGVDEAVVVQIEPPLLRAKYTCQ